MNHESREKGESASALLPTTRCNACRGREFKNMVSRARERKFTILISGSPSKDRRESIAVTAQRLLGTGKCLWRKAFFMIVGITMHQQPSGEGIRDPNGDQTPPEIAESSAKEANVNATAAPYYESTTEQYQTMPPHDVNGTGAPPSQVYVSSPPLVGQPPHPAMVGLEAQFQQFSLQHNGEDQLASSGHNDGSDTNNTEDYGGDEGEDDPVKLFVGQVRTERTKKRVRALGRVQGGRKMLAANNAVNLLHRSGSIAHLGTCRSFGGSAGKLRTE
jgi:hypothetical protein